MTLRPFQSSFTIRPSGMWMYSKISPSLIVQWNLLIVDTSRCMSSFHRYIVLKYTILKDTFGTSWSYRSVLIREVPLYHEYILIVCVMISFNSLQLIVRWVPGKGPPYGLNNILLMMRNGLLLVSIMNVVLNIGKNILIQMYIYNNH